MIGSVQATKALIPLVVAAALAGGTGCRQKSPDNNAGGEVAMRAIPADLLPKIVFPAGLDASQRTTLGLAGSGEFRLTDIDADVVVIEFLNTACVACQRQTPFLRRAYLQLDKDDAKRGRVKFLGVAVGNRAIETDRFVKEHKIPFPVLPDPLFQSYAGIGNPGGIPFIMIVTLRPPDGGRMLGRGHVGKIEDADRIVREIGDAFTVTEKTIGPPADWKLGVWREIEIGIPEPSLKELILGAAKGAGLAPSSVEKVVLESGETLYRLAGPGGTAWAKGVARSKLCNLCEDISFIVVFGEQGRIAAFEPLAIAKKDNVPWDEADNELVRGRVVGRSLEDPFVFDPSVDAVSGATMSCELIYDSMRQLGKTWRAMKQKGLIAAK